MRTSGKVAYRKAQCLETLYLSVFLISGLCFVIDYSIKLFDLFFSNSLSSKLLLERANKNQRKSFFGISSKSYTKHSKDKRKDNLSLEQRSKSYFESQTPKNQKLNLLYHNKSPNSKKNSSRMRRTDYKI